MAEAAKRPTHVLVFWDEPAILHLVTQVCTEEGYAVTTVRTVADALMVLRTSLHPIVALCERDHSSLPPDGPFFQHIYDRPDLYGQHRYVAFHSWQLSPEEQALLDALGVPLVSVPFSLTMLLEQIEQAVVSLAPGSSSA
jgi:hypothetical protein